VLEIPGSPSPRSPTGALVYIGVAVRLSACKVVGDEMRCHIVSGPGVVVSSFTADIKGGFDATVVQINC
jgi:hypothetical protein